jgi:hypothetical protein
MLKVFIRTPILKEQRGGGFPGEGIAEKGERSAALAKGGRVYTNGKRN